MIRIFLVLLCCLFASSEVYAQRSLAEIWSDAAARGSASAMELMRMNQVQNLENAKLNAEQMQRGLELQFQRERVQLEILERLQQMMLQVQQIQRHPEQIQLLELEIEQLELRIHQQLYHWGMRQLEFQLRLDTEENINAEIVRTIRGMLGNVTVKCGPSGSLGRSMKLAECLSEKHQKDLQTISENIFQSHQKKYEEQLYQLGERYDREQKVLFYIMQIQQHPEQMQQLESYVEQLARDVIRNKSEEAGGMCDVPKTVDGVTFLRIGEDYNCLKNE